MWEVENWETEASNILHKAAKKSLGRMHDGIRTAITDTYNVLEHAFREYLREAGKKNVTHRAKLPQMVEFYSKELNINKERLVSLYIFRTTRNDLSHNPMMIPPKQIVTKLLMTATICLEKIGLDVSKTKILLLQSMSDKNKLKQLRKSGTEVLRRAAVKYALEETGKKPRIPRIQIEELFRKRRNEKFRELKAERIKALQRLLKPFHHREEREEILLFAAKDGLISIVESEELLRIVREQPRLLPSIIRQLTKKI